MTAPLTFLELRCGAALTSIRILNQLLEVAMASLAVEASLRHDATLAVAELVANVCEHEYAGRQGEVGVKLQVDPDELRIELSSQGPPFDLTAALARAHASDPLEHLQSGGLGLKLIESLFDEATCEHPGGVNLIRLRKRLTG